MATVTVTARDQAGNTVSTSKTYTIAADPDAIGSICYINGSSWPIAGINVPRGDQQLIAYTPASGTVTTTNMWGTEVTVVDGLITAINKRQLNQDPNGTPIPANGYVLSGHDTAQDWLIANAAIGRAVTYTGSFGGSTGSAPQGLPSIVVQTYHMMWPRSDNSLIVNFPSSAGANVMTMAFVQGDPPTIVGWGNEGQTKFISDANALRAKGVRLHVSAGGSGGALNIANRDAFVNSIMALNAQVPLDGLDWDAEGTSMNSSDVVYISQRLKALRGNAFAITMAPNGSNIETYKSIAVALQSAGCLDMIGQQFYDAVVTNQAAKDRIAELVAAGISQAHIAIGMMVDTDTNHWTVDECVSAVNFIRATYPGVQKGYLWEDSRANTLDWVNRVGAALRV